MPETETPLANGENGSSDDFRDRKGRFLPGNPGGPGNPQARNVGTWRLALADAVSAEDMAEVARKLVKAAKKGAPWAVKELFDRCLGKPHVQIELQADTDYIREYDERLAVEYSRIARVLIEDAGERGLGALPAGKGEAVDGDVLVVEM